VIHPVAQTLDSELEAHDPGHSQPLVWCPREVSAIDESEFVRGILAQWELAARLAAHDAMASAQADKDHLVRQGYPLDACPNQPPTRDEIAAIIAKTDTIIANGETIARAWLRIRTHILAALVAEGGEQLYEQGEVPPTVRRPRIDEREPMTLPPIEVVTDAARDNGLLVPECEGVFNGCKFVNGVCEYCKEPAEREVDNESSDET
jgi:hypothetical protein